ncbi:MAG: hypothetical protein HY817_03605 [Candidatus Abawacabacteria bacterium]|nr:hypothetical protein [Candidatus Abawacabacteria bacterium]
MRPKPLPTLGHDDHQRRKGQAQVSEILEMGRTGISVFTAEFIEPEDNPHDALDNLLAVLAYTGLFDKHTE